MSEYRAQGQVKSHQQPWMVGSPVRSFKSDLDVPSTPPDTFTPVLRSTPSPNSGEIVMMCPQPQRAFWSPIAVHNSYNPSSNGSPMPDADASCQELRQVLGQTKNALVFPNYIPAFDRRPLSAASTQTPDSQITSPYNRLSPDLCDDQSWECDDADLLMRTQQMPGVDDEPHLPSHDRKLFVGGVPQGMTQDDLFNTFNQFADVKKAWLQREHYRDSSFKPSSRHKHRGFGFIIFRDDDALERLLGTEFSRHITLENGTKMEVKRAVSSRNLGNSNKMKGSHGPPYQELPSMPPFPVQFAGEALPVEEQSVRRSEWAPSVPASLGGGVSAPFNTEVVDVGGDAANADGCTAVFRLPSILPPSGKELAQMSLNSRKELELALLDAMPDHYTD